MLVVVRYPVRELHFDVDELILAVAALNLAVFVEKEVCTTTGALEDFVGHGLLPLLQKDAVPSRGTALNICKKLL